MEEPTYPSMDYSTPGIITGTWKTGLLWGRGPFNVTYQGTNVQNMYFCERVQFDNGLVIPNPLLKNGFWKSNYGPSGAYSTAVNHVFMTKDFPTIHTQFNQATGPDGYQYTTTIYCKPPANRDANDKSNYIIQPTGYKNIRDGQWHTLEYDIKGGTVANGDAEFRIWLDGQELCHTTGARWYAPGFAGTMNGLSWNPNSAGNTNSWSQDGHTSVDYWYVSGGNGSTPNPNPTPSPLPTVSLSASPASITSGGSSTLSWSTTNATSCTASGGTFTGSKATSGTQVVTPTTSTTYSLNCVGTGGSANANTSVTVGTTPPPPPTTGKFSIGDRVQVSSTDGANARTTPGGAIAGSHTNGELGTVTAGPQTAKLGTASYTWWNINYDSGADGWSAEGGLTKTSTPNPIPTPSPVPPPTTINRPNEPTGFTPIAEGSLDVLPAQIPGASTPLGWRGLWSKESGGALYVNNDLSAPQSPSSIFTTRFPDGLPAGTSPGATFQGWSNTPRSTNSNQYKALYTTFWMKIEGTQFYMNNNGLKLGYFGFGRSPGGVANEGILILEGAGSQHYYDNAFALHYYFGGHINPTVQINQKQGTGKPITVGSWHQIEVEQRLNTLGQSDGVLRSCPDRQSMFYFHQ
jgi:hypothetical protein